MVEPRLSNDKINCNYLNRCSGVCSLDLPCLQFSEYSVGDSEFPILSTLLPVLLLKLFPVETQLCRLAFPLLMSSSSTLDPSRPTRYNFLSFLQFGLCSSPSSYRFLTSPQSLLYTIFSTLLSFISHSSPHFSSPVHPFLSPLFLSRTSLLTLSFLLIELPSFDMFSPASFLLHQFIASPLFASSSAFHLADISFPTLITSPLFPHFTLSSSFYLPSLASPLHLSFPLIPSPSTAASSHIPPSSSRRRLVTSMSGTSQLLVNLRSVFANISILRCAPLLTSNSISLQLHFAGIQAFIRKPLVRGLNWRCGRICHAEPRPPPSPSRSPSPQAQCTLLYFSEILHPKKDVLLLG